MSSGAADFHAPSLQYDGLNQEEFMNHKRPQRSPPAANYQPEFSDSNPQWLSLNVDHDYPNANPENGVMSKAVKRQKMVQNGQFASASAPQSNYGQGLITGGSSPAHPSGKLSEQLDKNSGPVHASPHWDPELAKLRIPGTSIDEEILDDLMHEFKSRTGELLAVRNLILVDEGFSHLRDHLPVKLYEVPIDPFLYQIRIALAPEFVEHSINPEPNLCTLNPKRKIMKQVTSLIAWLLYINAAVLRNLNATGTMSTNRKLVDWVFNKIFEPQNSLPVIGRFRSQDMQAFTKGNEFGPIQKMLITLLSSSLRSNREPQTAVRIINNYYENECPEVLCALKSGKLPDLRSLAIESKKSNVIIGSGLDEGSWIQEIGNFPVRSLQQLPESLKPKFGTTDTLNCWIRMRLGAEKLELSSHIMQILSVRNPPMSQSYSFNFNDSKFPVVITSSNKPTRCHRKFCLISTPGKRFPRQGHDNCMFNCFPGFAFILQKRLNK
ncbi:hypothetical protein VP01_1204g3 [Puccinia sorghi]|uniref:Uncharacterized protein n=1 Tax=Puccinia sorghi TaxID=27349 RepID=A0A0L6VQG2_9BASI|nr:hypothetical protein VP01_1204g3 [Puccinia sorghi]